LVGTVIVAAIAIIFLPDLLDGNKKKHNAQFENIPQAPKIELNVKIQEFPEEKLKPVDSSENELVEVEQDTVLEIVEIDQENAIENVGKSIDDGKVKISTLAKNVTETKPKPAPVKVVKKELPEKINIKEAWVIQLGSFRHKKNVNALIDKLKYHGYTTFTKPIKTKNGTLTKVFVGPNINKNSLESKIGPLKSLTNVQGKVTRYYPAKL
jgi:DedD protein